MTHILIFLHWFVLVFTFGNVELVTIDNSKSNDYPIEELNGYTLREVFENRNIAMPNLNGKEYLGDGWYKWYTPPSGNGLVKYNINTGEVDISGLFTSTGGITLMRFDMPLGDYTFKVYDRFGNVGGIEVLGTQTQYYGLTAFDNALFLTNKIAWRIYLYNTSQTIDVKFKIQIENGSILTPYQVPTNGPYNTIDLSTFNLTIQEINDLYNVYQENEQREIDNTYDYIENELTTNDLIYIVLFALLWGLAIKFVKGVM